MKRSISLLALLALLAACQSPGPVAEPGGAAGDGETCGAARYSAVVGQRLDAVRVQEGLKVRIVAPDSVVTMDFRPDRLNFGTDRTGTIVRVYCG